MTHAYVLYEQWEMEQPWADLNLGQKIQESKI